MSKVCIHTWKDRSHEGDDDGRQWVAEIVEDKPVEEEPETLHMTGWFLTEQEAIEDVKSWLREHSRYKLS